MALVLAILAQAPRAYQAFQSGSGESTYIVVLQEPSVAQRVLRRRSAAPALPARQLLKGAGTAGHKRAVESSQRRFLSSIGQNPGTDGVQVLHRETLLINSLVVKATALEVQELENHPSVQGVYPNRERVLLMDAAPQLVGAPAAWQEVGGSEEAGLGIKIGLIDSGINQDHVMFLDPDLVPPEGFPISESEGFATNKVIVDRTFVKTEFGMRPQADQTPRDEFGHGSQVAGAAAGVAVDSPLAPVSGIAPRAFLGNYKVFGTPGTNSTTTSAAVIAAINAAVADGMDVINLSLGGPAIDPDRDPEQMVIASVTALGFVFVIAAGNAGPGRGSILSPGTSPAAITVGASTNPRTFGSAVELTSNSPDFPDELRTILAVASNQDAIQDPIGPLPVATITEFDPTEQGCSSALAVGSLEGKVALVRRGNCTFCAKAQNVLTETGAAGMLVYNNVNGSPISMAWQDPDIDDCRAPTVPAVMITKSDGEKLLEFLDGLNPAGPPQVVVEVTFLTQGDLRPFPTAPDILAGFSGRGPNIDLGIKPDLTAPGVAIHTASNGSGFILSADGTSFAVPMIAGGAALLLQRFPGWSAAQVKSALVNSAVQVVTVNGAPGLVNEVGNGRLDLGRAFEVAAFLDPVSTSFGRIPAASSTRRSVLVSNAVSTVKTYELSVEILVGEADVAVVVTPETLELGSLETVEIHLDVSPAGSAANGAFEGALTLAASDRDATDLRLPFWGTLVANSVDLLQGAQTPKQGVFTSLEEALAEAGPGDTIEIIDSGSYQAPLLIEFNGDGTRLDGITLRAAQGQLPVIQVSGSDAAVEVRNLRNVTLQDLLVRGKEIGIKVENSSVKIIGCRVETSGQPSDQSGAIHLTDSHAHVVESELAAGSGNGLAAFSSEVLVEHSLIEGEEQGSAVHGIFASPGSTLAIFDTDIIGSGETSTGQGVRASGSQVLVKGSRIMNSRGDLGDGVLVLGESQLDLADSSIVNNRRAGVCSFNGAVSTIRGSEVGGNETAGLMAQAASVRVRSSLLTANGKGAIALQAGQLDIRDSVLAGSADEGVEVTDSQLTLINTTVYGSGGTGVQIVSTPAVVANSILFQNLAGDLQDDGSSSSVTFNLVGDLSTAGEAGNFTGNPAFADPQGFDFSLSEDSDAVDRGTHAVSLSAVDLDFHRRIVDGDGDGDARVDVGALEFASEATEPLILPLLTTEAGHFIGLALANALSTATSSPLLNEIAIRAYRPDGSLAGNLQIEAASLTQEAFLVREKFPDLGEGWLEILPSQKDLMSFTLTGDSGLTRMDGSQLAPARGSRLFFPEIRNREGETTTLFVVNPHQSSINVAFYWHPAGLERELLDIRTIPARGSLRTSLEDLGSTASTGYLSVEGEDSIFAMELFGNNQMTGGLLALDEESVDSNLYGAQLASGPEVETFLSLIHTGQDGVLVNLVVRSELGEVVASKWQEVGPNGHLNGSVRDLVGLEEEFVEGWLAVHSLNGQLLGSISFQDPAGRFLASLPLQSQGAREFLLSHVAQTPEIFTGVTLLNASTGTALVSVEVFTAEGVQRGALFLELGSNQKVAFVLPEVFAGFGNQERGFIRVRSSRGIFGFELFGRQDLEFLSAVPQQTVIN